jgi:pyruvate/2-oxoglutarate dehydrogenase complex dihydrolipoamide acyltransferase (E2) component
MKDIPMPRIGLNGRISKNPEGKHRRQSPLVRKWLRKYGINASDVMKRGDCDRLTKQDVETYMAQIGEAMLRDAGIKQA